MERKTVGLFADWRLLQDDSAPPLGTDAVLLSAFTRAPLPSPVCDLGTGGGALLVLLCARHPALSGEGVEISSAAAALARDNLALNGLSGRAAVRCADLRRVPELYPPACFGSVVANPPYFRPGHGARAGTPRREEARSERCCTISDVCRAAAYLLPTGGRFFVVYRPERLCGLTEAMREAGLEPKRLRTVHALEGAPPSLLLCEGRRGGREGLLWEPPLVLYGKDGAPTPEVGRIYGGGPMDGAKIIITGKPET